MREIFKIKFRGKSKTLHILPSGIRLSLPGMHAGEANFCPWGS